jgi:hypothetical protein
MTFFFPAWKIIFKNFILFKRIRKRNVWVKWIQSDADEHSDNFKLGRDTLDGDDWGVDCTRGTGKRLSSLRPVRPSVAAAAAQSKLHEPTHRRPTHVLMGRGFISLLAARHLVWLISKSLDQTFFLFFQFYFIFAFYLFGFSFVVGWLITLTARLSSNSRAAHLHFHPSPTLFPSRIFADYSEFSAFPFLPCLIFHFRLVERILNPVWQASAQSSRMARPSSPGAHWNGRRRLVAIEFRNTYSITAAHCLITTFISSFFDDFSNISPLFFVFVLIRIDRWRCTCSYGNDR